MPYRETEATRRRATQKRASFVSAAVDLVSAHGFAHAKVRAIAKASGSSAGSLYSYFDSHEELLAEVFRVAAGHELAAVREAVGRAGPGAEERLSALVATFVDRALRGRQLAWSLLFEPSSQLIEAERLVYRRAYVELGENIVRDGVTSGRLVEQDPTLASSAVMGAVSEALSGRLNPVGVDTLSRLSDTQVIEQIEAFCFRALGRPEATITSQASPSS